MEEEEIVWFPERPPTTQLCVLLPVTVTTHLKSSTTGKSRLILQVEPGPSTACGGGLDVAGCHLIYVFLPSVRTNQHQAALSDMIGQERRGLGLV